MKKNGCGQNPQRACGSTPKPHCVIGVGKGPPLDLKPILTIIIKSVSWVTEDFLCENEWVTDTNVVLKGNDILEALNFDIDVPGVPQW